MTEMGDDGWYTGEINGKIGHFPSMLVHGLDEDVDHEEEAEEEDEEEEEEGKHKMVD